MAILLGMGSIVSSSCAAFKCKKLLKYIDSKINFLLVRARSKSKLKKNVKKKVPELARIL